jgi:hypothetical protein
MQLFVTGASFASSLPLAERALVSTARSSSGGPNYASWCSTTRGKGSASLAREAVGRGLLPGALIALGERDTEAVAPSSR